MVSGARSILWPMMGEDDTMRRLLGAGQPSAHLEPLDDHVVIQPSDDDHETRAGLIIPASAESAVHAGVVVAVGDDVTGVAPGDKVVYPRAAAIDVRLGGDPVVIVRRRDIVARVAE